MHIVKKPLKEFDCKRINVYNIQLYSIMMFAVNVNDVTGALSMNAT